MRASMPFTKRLDSSVEKRCASSTASEMTAPVGTSGRCSNSKTPMRSRARSRAGMRSIVQSLA
ncbi:MAG: hypothetical protein AVDCRST_MAG10-3457 [uncultured Acidimicrobiales bacterium]|uniref:Uncharacterized protein n=1 Tax=uncultured Acidimicrobiales bacterium TaxID=310071 RepID=A0A6J4J8U3_9ACTN|nr:MAG: hypothetical protein AVDCRST_MAG10-3457 [uncultured Acidimicrobiales bacterium]